MAKLSKAERDALDDSAFAVPKKRKILMTDENHVRFGWDMVDRTGGLTPEERAEARRRLLRRAHELGISTEEWRKMAAMNLGVEAFEVDDESDHEDHPIGEPLKATGMKFEAMSSFRFDAASLDIPPDDGHSNKMPFRGVLTKLDAPSDGAPNGSGGRKVIVTKQAAEKALSSLPMMGVNLTEDLGGHNPRNKVGVITAADIDGDSIRIAGHLYKGDFPDVARTVKDRKSDLGFSFEADNIFVESTSAAVLKITSMCFTGASILLKNKAAYRSTSLAASAAKDIETMTPEELGAAIALAMKPFAERLEKIEAGSTENPGKVEANAALVEQVKPHAERIQDAANAIHSDGLGGGTYGATAYILGIGQEFLRPQYQRKACLIAIGWRDRGRRKHRP